MSLLFALLTGLSLFAAPPKSTGMIAVGLMSEGASTSSSNSDEDYIRKGAGLAFRDADAEKRVEWMSYGESTEQTLKAVEKINRERPLIFIGMGHSFQALLAANRVSPTTVILTPVATSDEILRKKGNVLLLANTNTVQAKMLADEMVRQIKPREKILLIEIAGCPYCVDMAEAVRTELKARDLEPIDAKIHLSQLASPPKSILALADYDHVVLPTLEPESARMIDVLHAANPKATFWGGDGWGTLARYIRQLPYLNTLKVFWLSHYQVDIQTKRNRDFVKRYRQAYKSDPIDTAAFYYEAVEVALKNKPDATAAEVMANFRGLKHYEGLTGPVRVLGDHVERPMPLLTIARGQVKLHKMLTPGKSK